MFTIKRLNPNVMHIRYLPLFEWGIAALYGSTGLIGLFRPGGWFLGILLLIAALFGLLFGEVQIWTLDNQRGTAIFKKFGVLGSKVDEYP